MHKKPSPALPRILLPRQQTLVAYQAITRLQQPLDRAMRHLQDDKAFAAMLLLQSLRAGKAAQQYISTHTRKPLPDTAYDIVSLGIIQCWCMDVPAYAAIATTLQLLDYHNFTHLKGVANALLRRLPPCPDADYLAQQWLSGWLWDTLHHAYGEATTHAIAQASLKPAALDCTPLYPDHGLDGTLLPTGSIRLPHSTSVPNLPHYDTGRWQVQDAAAAIPATLFPAYTGKTIIDVGAAPGGKTAQLCAAGAQVIALDSNRHRLQRLTENLQRLHLPAEIVNADATQWQPPEPVDGVLLDAPCTATGTLRRHPDLPWHKTPEHRASLCQLQQQLLQHTARWLKPGGMLVYCVCSLLPEEGEAQIVRFLAEQPDMRLAPLTVEAYPALASFIQTDGTLRTAPHLWPAHGGLDGFFVARLQKNG